MDDDDTLADRFDEHRPHLRAVAYRMLGSLSEADDAVQDAWLRASRAGADDVDNLRGWLTTIVARVSLNMLRSRTRRREDALGVHLPDPVVALEPAEQPDEQALTADAIGLALLVVLDTLTPAERLAFVLHDLFGLPFDEIAPMVERSPAAARQLASRARRRVRGADVHGGAPDRARQREVVDAFFAAARGGDMERLVALLDPDVVLRADGGDRRPSLSRVVHGAAAVAEQAVMFAMPAVDLRPVLVNGASGVLVTAGRRPIALMAFTFTFTATGDTIAAIDSIADPDRVARVAEVALH